MPNFCKNCDFYFENVAFANHAGNFCFREFYDRIGVHYLETRSKMEIFKSFVMGNFNDTEIKILPDGYCDINSAGNDGTKNGLSKAIYINPLENPVPEKCHFKLEREILQ